MIFVIFFFLGIAIFSGSVDYGVCGGIQPGDGGESS